MNKSAFLCVVVSLFLTGCANHPFGGFLQTSTQKHQPPTQAQLVRKEADLKKIVAKDPDNASAQYTYGRILLALDKPRQALLHLKRAEILTRDNIDYMFWLGVAYGKNGRLSEEQVSYSRVLQLNPQHIQAMVYQGNSYLKSKNFQPSLDCYQRALALQPDNEQALYNRAVIYKKLRRKSEERQAWKLYLQSHPSGTLAIKAVGNLNYLNDFSYRNHHLGRRVVSLPAITYTPSTANLTRTDREILERIGAIAVNLKTGPLDIIVYRKNNAPLARNRAITIKRYLEKEFPTLADNDRIRISWFNVPEKQRISGRRVTIDDSTVFFLSQAPAKPIKLKPQGKRKK